MTIATDTGLQAIPSGKSTANWTRENLAWLAGLVEGEGCFQYSKSKCLSIAVAMTDEDVLRKAHLIAGVGHVYGPSRKRPGRKIYWRWTVARQAESYALMIALYSWLGLRRQATIQETLTRWLDWQRNKPPRVGNRTPRKMTPQILAEIMVSFGNGPAFPRGARKKLAEKFGLDATTITRAAQKEASRLE